MSKKERGVPAGIGHVSVMLVNKVTLAFIVIALFAVGNLNAGTITVTNSADSGAGTLRQALLDANDDDIIDFDASVTYITLTNGVPHINDSVHIKGPGPDNLTIDCKAHNRGFYMTASGKTAIISGLTITNGLSTSTGGGIYHGGDSTVEMTISTCVITGCTVSDGTGGGAIMATGGRCTIIDTTITGCETLGSANGGAVYDDTGAEVYMEEYFAINRPRQYGKTTMLDKIERMLDDKCVLISLSFAGVGDTIFENEESFSPRLVEMFARTVSMTYPATAELIRNIAINVVDLETLSIFITEFIQKTDRDVVLLIDEVDKASNNQLFVSFLAMLRDKYLLRERGKDFTFKSIVLAGVHDVKSLKLKLREGEEAKINSPWNIAADFNVDMSFNPAEIKTMLVDYAEDKGVKMDFDALAERIHYYTSGYPFLVSKICKNIDEEEAKQNPDYEPKHWTLDDIDWSFRWLTREDYTTTNFDDLTKNLESNPELFRLVNAILFNGADESVTFAVMNPIVNLGLLYGMFKEKNGRTVIHNRIYEQILSSYMRSKEETALRTQVFSGWDLGYDLDGYLDMNRILLKFQEFMKEHYSNKDASFIEREGRLVFMSFLKPIVNGKGFMWKEPVVADERRMDIVVTFGKDQKEVIELKIWRGEKYHQRGLQQLSEYLDFQGIKTGYLLIFDFNKNKQYKSEQIIFADKEIFAVTVQ